MRYFAHLAYRGTHFSGYQIQSNVRTVQGEIEKALSILCKKDVPVVGCGRTDTGVHAHSYYLHFDLEETLPPNLLYNLNGILDNDIVIYSITPTKKHARFDATYRKYIYSISTIKTPFQQDTVYHHYKAKNLDLAKLNEAGNLLMNYSDFNTFCKAGHQSKTTICNLMEAHWVYDKNSGQLQFHIAANRFLRGMVRLIVGMCLNVAEGKVDLNDVKIALDNKAKLEKGYSVPALGLSLVEIRYT